MCRKTSPPSFTAASLGRIYFACLGDLFVGDTHSTEDCHCVAMNGTGPSPPISPTTLQTQRQLTLFREKREPLGNPEHLKAK